MIGSLDVSCVITYMSGDMYSLKLSKGSTSMTVQPFYIDLEIGVETVEGYTGIETVMAKRTLDVAEVVGVTINAIHKEGTKINITSNPNTAVTVRNPNVASYANGLLTGLNLGKTFVDISYTDAEKNMLGTSVEITVGTEIPPSANAIYVNGAAVPNFSPSVLNYVMALPSGPAVINLTADMPGAGLSYSFEPPASLPGNATLTVATVWGKSVTYTIRFEIPQPKLTSFTFGGDVFNVADKTEFDVNVAKTMSNIAFSAANVTCVYPDNVDVNVVFMPENGSVGAGTNPVLRNSSNSQPTAPIRTNTAVPGGSNHWGVWFFSTPNTTTGQTSACLHSFNDASNVWIFALFGNANGFVGEGGNIANNAGLVTTFQANAPIKLYEKVIEMRPAL